MSTPETSKPARLLVETLRDVWNSPADPNATAITVPFGPDHSPQSKTLDISYSRLSYLINQLSRILYFRYNIRPGDVVSTYYHNGVPIILSFFGITNIGGIIAPLNPSYKSSSLSFYFNDSKPKLILIPSLNTNNLIENECIPTAIKHNIIILRFSVDLTVPGGNLILSDYKRNIIPSGPIAKYTKSLEYYKPTPNDVALILHTSGTTGNPKGVPLKHGNICQTISNIINHYELTSSDTCLVVMPLFHVHGLIGCLLSTLSSNGTCVVPYGKFRATTFWKNMIYNNCSWYSGVSTIHQILLKNYKKDYLPVINNMNSHDRDYYLNNRWRFVRSCSASLPAAVLKKLEETFNKPYLEAYAMTEASHQMTANPLPKYGVHKPGSVGKPTGVNVKILNEKNEELINIGEIGEIAIRGPNVVSEYLNRPDANKKCFVNVICKKTGKIGNVIYFKTGDQGKFDEDGYLYLTGRLKEMINRGGEKIAPLEIDNVILKHKDVNIAVAFGAPDNMYGEVVNVAVVLNDGVSSNKGIDEIKKEIIEMCKNNLAGYKVPTKIFIANDVPRTATGKIQRRVVAAHFLKQNQSKL